MPAADAGNAAVRAAPAGCTMSKALCTWCGYVYDPAAGDLDRGVAPGTPFEALHDSWCCPDCRAPQADFVPVDESAKP